MILAANGPGPRLAGVALQAALAARNGGDVEAIISTGFCGAADPALHAGDIFVATAVNHFAARMPHTGRPFHSGPLFSGDRVVGTAPEKAELLKGGWRAVEMEAAAVAQEALARGVAFFCVRVVTDTAPEDMPLDFNRLRGADGRFSRARIAAAALAHPWLRIPALIKLEARCRAASVELGNFLANCQFRD